MQPLLFRTISNNERKSVKPFEWGCQRLITFQINILPILCCLLGGWGRLGFYRLWSEVSLPSNNHLHCHNAHYSAQQLQNSRCQNKLHEKLWASLFPEDSECSGPGGSLCLFLIANRNSHFSLNVAKYTVSVSNLRSETFRLCSKNKTTSFKIMRNQTSENPALPSRVSCGSLRMSR